MPCSVSEAVHLDERLELETEELQAEAGGELVALLGRVTSTDYRRFLERTLGFVAPLERSLWATVGLEHLVDMRRFRKQTLLRHDLMGFGLKHDEIESLPRAEIPQLESPAAALGWAYIVERSTLLHVNVFRHLASVMPGDVAYTASYLKAHFGAVRENWKRFADAINSIASDSDEADVLIAAARAAFHAHRAWRDCYEQITIGGRRERVA
jgi:heme oxygenase (biliverdin-IX-beta and delta-forming)